MFKRTSFVMLTVGWFLFMGECSFAQEVFAAEVTLMWDANSPEEGVTEYRIYYGTSSRYAPSSNGYAFTYPPPNEKLSDTQCTIHIEDPEIDRTYYFAVKAFDDAGNSSDYSNEASTIIPAGLSIPAQDPITYINAIYNAGITEAPPDNFNPDKLVNRGDTAIFITRALFTNNFNYTDTPYFSDVPPDHYAFKYIQKFKDVGITQSKDIYNSNRFANRADIAIFITRALFSENFNYTATPYFSDVPPEHYAFKYVQKFKDIGITRAEGTFNPDNLVLRVDMAIFIARAFLGMQ